MNASGETRDKSTPPVKWHRWALGLASAVLIGTGMLITAMTGVNLNSQEYFSGTLLKVGMVLGLVWLAAPQLEKLGWQRMRGTLLVSIIIVLVLFSIRARIGMWAGAMLLAACGLVSILGWMRKNFQS